MNLELVGALNELEKERGISKEILFEAIEAALVSAYKRNYGNSLNVRVDINEKTGQIRVFVRKDVVDEVLDEANEISLEEARAIDPKYELDDIVEIEVTPHDFGRIAAQTAKQVVIQRIREAERALIYEEFSNREGDIVTGIVQRHEHRNVLIDLGKVEAVLPPTEQVHRDNYAPGTRLKVYISEVRRTTKGPQVFVSRSHPGLLKRLFELEVPEIHDGVVEIKAVAREAGNRSKIAVYSSDRNVDPVGACVGPRGMRVQAVVDELGGEKIDIIAWDPQPDRFIANALSPAKVVRVIVDPFEKSARAVVPDHQLSLAIGKEGQNARLAARLTGWKIDIKSESQMRELVALEALRPKVAPPEITLSAPVSPVGAADDVHAAEIDAAETAPVEDVEAQATLELDAPVEDVEDDTVAPTGEAYDEAAEAVESPVLEPAAPEEPEADFHYDDEEGPYGDDELADEVADEETTDASDLDLLDDDDDEALDEPIPQPAKAKKKRALREERLEDLIVDAVDMEDEPLPSLFEAEPESLEVQPPPPVREVRPKLAKAKPGSKKKAAQKGDESERRVIKDLSELAKLIRDDSKD